MNIRKAALQDTAAWIDLIRAVLGDDYPDKQTYEAAWAADQLQGNEAETWVAEEQGRIYSSLSFLMPGAENQNPVGNIGRHLNRPESFSNGAAQALMEKALEIANERKQMLISRVIGSDQQQQLLYERSGHRVRESVLFYYRTGGHDIGKRLPLSESLPHVAELAHLVLGRFNLPDLIQVRDGVTGYPLQGESAFSEGTRDDFELWKLQAMSSNPPVELSGLYNQGQGFMRTTNQSQPLAVFAAREGKMVAGLLYSYDTVDRCVRVHDSFSQDDLSIGAALNQLVKHELIEVREHLLKAC
jgi:hypothetical protein